MSKKNGDKARYHREQKKKNRRRQQTRELKKQLGLKDGGTRAAESLSQ